MGNQRNHGIGGAIFFDKYDRNIINDNPQYTNIIQKINELKSPEKLTRLGTTMGSIDPKQQGLIFEPAVGFEN